MARAKDGAAPLQPLLNTQAKTHTLQKSHKCIAKTAQWIYFATFPRVGETRILKTLQKQR